jgi:hypothetical protein
MSVFGWMVNPGFGSLEPILIWLVAYKEVGA